MGMAGEDFPELIVPNVYTTPQDYRFKKRIVPAFDRLVEDFNPSKYLFGNEALEYHELLEQRYLMVEQNFPVLKEFLNHYFTEMEINARMQSVVLITPPLAGYDFKAQFQDLFFREFGVPRLYFISAPFSSLFAMNKQSGVVVGMGEHYTTVQSIYRGFPGESSFFESNVNGSAITKYFHQLLQENSAFYGTILNTEIVRDLKERMIYCAENYKEALGHIQEGNSKYNKSVILPNGKKIVINKERIEAPETYFQPLLINSTSDSLPALIKKSIQSWDRSTRQELMENIILCGGSSTIPGLSDRLENELRAIFPPSVPIKVHAVSGRENIEWIGASVLVTKGVPDQKWIPNEEWVNPETDESSSDSTENRVPGEDPE